MEKPEPTSLDTTPQTIQKMSKRKRKKIEKQKRWLERKDEFLEKRKKKRKEYKMKRRQREKAEIKKLIETGNFVSRPNNRKLKIKALSKIRDSPLLIIDSSFENDIEERPLKSLIKQYGHVNSIMKKNEKIFRVEITGIQEKSLAMINECFGDKWVVRSFKEDYLEMLSKKDKRDCWGQPLEVYDHPLQKLGIQEKVSSNKIETEKNEKNNGSAILDKKDTSEDQNIFDLEMQKKIKDKLVYLTGDAEENMDELDER